jgi:hypothetical protein
MRRETARGFGWRSEWRERSDERRLVARFDQEMWRLYEEAKTWCGYNATYYRQMLVQYGALETACRLAGEPTHHEGLTRLWERGALDLSVEALVLRAPWDQLFTAEVLAAARKKLLALDYSERGDLSN